MKEKFQMLSTVYYFLLFTFSVALEKTYIIILFLIWFVSLGLLKILEDKDTPYILIITESALKLIITAGIPLYLCYSLFIGSFKYGLFANSWNVLKNMFMSDSFITSFLAVGTWFTLFGIIKYSVMFLIYYIDSRHNTAEKSFDYAFDKLFPNLKK